jgi:hypothetical protein
MGPALITRASTGIGAVYADRLTKRGYDRGFQATSYTSRVNSPRSIFFSFHPFANISSAVLQLHAIRFATQEKAHYIAIDYANVFEI